MSNRTRSNTNFAKMPMSLGLRGTKTYSDRLKTISTLVSAIELHKQKIKEETSSKTQDVAKVTRWTNKIKDCLQTIRIELNNITKNNDLISEVMKLIENGDYKKAEKKIATIPAGLNPQVYGAMRTKNQRG